MLTEQRQRELDRLLDGDLPDDERARVQASLETDPEAVEWLANRAELHSNLRRSMKRRGIEDGAKVVNLSAKADTTFFSRFAMPIAAALLGLLAFAALFKKPTDPTFATMTRTHSAFWESGDLPTSDGSRLGKGTLRLAEGMATLKFDSGAEVVLEAPATLVLVDAMKCELSRGTAVSDIPDSALGFRIKTPSADVVDYGTRFAVSVYEDTGETHTQVIEGKVQVEYAKSDKIVELNTGQKNTVVGETVGEAAEYRTIPVEPIDHGPDWTLLEPQKDAYTGQVKGHESDVLLYVKNAVDSERVNRRSYIGFDLSQTDQATIDDAELLLYFSPTGWGLASHIADAQFSVYGMVGDVPEWDESILHNQFPGTPELTHLGSFTLPQGVQKGRFGIQTDELKAFLRNHSSAEITLKVVRDTKETENSGLVHGFASRRHPFLPAPTLAIRQKNQS